MIIGGDGFRILALIARALTVVAWIGLDRERSLSFAVVLWST
jgi:hypothetical protein